MKREMRLSILLAEDNLYTLEQYNRILEKNGCKVTVARDGVEVLEKYDKELKKIQFDKPDVNPFDVVLLDNNMPKKTGAEAASEILEKKPTQKIIFASAYDIDSIKNAPEIKDSVEVLQKPFSLNTLLRRIKNG